MDMHSLFAGFPNLHPLFVHFPIVLLLLAAVAQSSVLFFPTNTQLKWLSFSLIVSATVGAFIACKTGVHISGDADEKAFPIFETHKLLALKGMEFFPNNFHHLIFTKNEI